jgi:hypothetical protein
MTTVEKVMAAEKARDLWLQTVADRKAMQAAEAKAVALRQSAEALEAADRADLEAKAKAAFDALLSPEEEAETAAPETAA